VRSLSIVALPFRLALGTGLAALVALSIIPLGSRLLRWSARGLALVFVIALVGAQVNAHYAYFPTLGALLGRRAADEISAADFQRLEARYVRTLGNRFRSYGGVAASGTSPGLPLRGVVLAFRFPPTVSHFAQHPGEVYLPPIWFENPHPHLPVIELLHGSPGSPADWTRGGFADVTADAYASTHGGFAPILVMPDVNGASWWNDSECVNGVKGAAETYLTVDVRNAVAQAFGARADGRSWAVAGLSEGGSCALQMALRHPDEFAVAGDFGGDDHPYVHGGMRRLFFGRTNAELAAAEAQYDPRVLLSRWRSSPMPALAFGVGRSDDVHERLERLLTRARADGFATWSNTYPGSHSFRVFSRCFRDSLPWIVAHLDLTPPPTRGHTERVVVRAGRDNTHR